MELRLDGLFIKKSDAALDEFKKQVQERIRANLPSLDAVKDQKVFRAYRDFFWGVGVDPTKTRPAGEALTRRILSGWGLPTINTFVDSYNLASAETGIAIAAFDLSKVSGPDLSMRKATPREVFLGIGMEAPIELKGVEMVIEDSRSRELVAVYPYRDSDGSKVTEESESALLMMCGVPGIETSLLEEARDVAKRYVERFCTRAPGRGPRPGARHPALEPDTSR